MSIVIKVTDKRELPPVIKINGKVYKVK